ncbi:MAG: hypothetical protein QOE38_1355, partial [Thermoleophilaceae bacterium]|nr:hypothetical protein [Thermoleophilaceae bacterium]
MRARVYTAAELAARRSALADVGAAVVLFGSWGRDELTAQSDDDWAVLGADAGEAVLARCRAVLGGAEREPGQQDLFGVAFACDDLTRNIGLDADTNANLTRRMLLLLESRAVAGFEEHARCSARVLDAYLGHGVRDYRPPRFLLNDLIRYWRTICVDFEGKRRGAGGDDPKYASRNAKLRTSRKVLFAGGLLAVLLCHMKTAAEMPAFLMRQFAAPPTDRLAAAFIQQGALAEGVRALGAYDRWIGMLSSAVLRAELAALRDSTREGSALFAQVREIGDELQRGLL